MSEQQTPVVTANPPPPPTPTQNDNGTEQEKKKKRRKRNNNNSSANVTTANNNNATTTTVVTNNAVLNTPTVTTDNDSSNKKSKEKKNEANKKGKKQSPEPIEKGIPNSPPNVPTDDKTSSLASEVAKARQHIKSSLECVDRISSFSNTGGDQNLVNRILTLEKENEGLRQLVDKMQISQNTFEARLKELEKKCLTLSVSGGSKPAQTPVSAPVKKPAPPAADDDDDDVDLFGSDSDNEDADAKAIREKRLAEYAARKSKKPALIAKSNVILDVKPWDDETDMKILEKEVRSIEMDGLLWGASKLVPLAYGIHKLQISCVVEDEKVSIDLLTEAIEEKQDYVQSVDIAAFNKI